MTRGRIVVADDDRAFVEAVAIYLQDHGFQVTKAYSGREAIAACMRQHVDVAVIDVHLPDLDGVCVAVEFNRSQPGTSTVLISGDDSDETTRRCRSSSALAFMAKPLMPSQLLETVSAAIRSGRDCVPAENT